MKHLEIERRFLLYPCSAKRLLARVGVEYESIPITQFYLVADARRVERYRREGKRYVLTRKEGSGLARVEEEYGITKEDFEKALGKNRGGVIRKRRFVFRLEGRRYELDSFKGRLKGLNILEIEFTSVDEAEAFVLPGPLARAVVAEVTENPDFTNGAISRTMRIPALEEELEALLKKAGRRKSFLKASTEVPLGPYESGAHALKAILYTLLESVEANRKAILSGDDDPERLHQLRVAMRKQRALFSQMAPLFEKEWAEEHKSRLAELMRRTGTKRDIDVYLMQIPRYRSLLSGGHQAGIDRLEAYLKERERQEREALRSFLTGREFGEEMASLARFCRRDDREGLDERAEGPVVIEVKQAIRRRYRKVLEKGSAIGPRSEAEAYHRLRIDVKKLRYMMEFFAAIFEPDAYREMLGRLKEIQTILGEHQDLDVQRRHLKEFTRIESLHTEETLEAIAALREEMAKLEEKKRREFREAFVGFSRTRELLRRMVCHY
jgi:CHAD domain-containing protein/CYTH domain-containing protein